MAHSSNSAAASSSTTQATLDSWRDITVEGPRSRTKRVLPDNTSDPEGNGSKKKKPKRKTKSKGKGKASQKRKKKQKKETGSSSSSETETEDNSDAATEADDSSSAALPDLIPTEPQRKRSFRGRPKGSYEHRRTLPGRAVGNVAADHVRFRESTSLVYHFLHITDSEVDDGDLVACNLECTWCQGTSNGPNWQWSVTSQGSTSNFSVHFEKHHPVEWGAIKKADAILMGKEADEGKASGSAKIEDFFTQAFDWKKWNELLVRWLVASNQPFAEVENPEFRALVGHLRPFVEKKLIRADQLKNITMDAAQAARERLKDLLQQKAGAIALACDAWTSTNRLAFLALVASYIDKDWKLHTVLVDFIELHGSHTGDNLGQVIYESVKELGIERKVITMTADNASNNATMMKKLDQLLDGDGIVFDASDCTIRCLAHVIHLAVMALLVSVKAVKKKDVRDDEVDFSVDWDEEAAEGVEYGGELDELGTLEDDEELLRNQDDDGVDLTSAIQKIRAICRLVRASVQRSEDFQDAITAVNSAIRRANRDRSESNKEAELKLLVLILDVVTRWNSTFFMIERAHKLCKAVDTLTAERKNKVYHRYALSDGEWTLLEKIMDFLKIFRDASTQMSAERHPTLGTSLTWYTYLIRKVQNFQRTELAQMNSSLRDGLTMCLNKLKKYFDASTSGSSFYYMATILDPRIKDSLFSTRNRDLFPTSWLQCEHEFFVDFIRAKNPTDPDAPSTPTTEHANKSTIFAGLDMSAVLGTAPAAPAPQTIPEELAAYLAIRVDQTVSPLDWWRENERFYPRLATVARGVLAIPGASTNVERKFNGGRDMISIRRASLKATTIRELTLFRSVLEYEKELEACAD